MENLERKDTFLKAFQENGITPEKGPDGPELYFPAKYDGLEKLREDAGAVRTFERLVKLAREYAGGITVRDRFDTDHTKRRAWINEIDKKYPGFRLYYKSVNKLGGNNINGVTGQMLALISKLDQLEVHTPQSEKIREIEHRIPWNYFENYQDLDYSGKIAIADKMDRICRDFLRVVTGIEV